MASSHEYDGNALTTVRIDSASFSQSAELGAVASSTVTIADDAGTLEIVGQKDWLSSESASTPTVLLRGFVDIRRYIRTNGPPVLASRNIDVPLVDLNATLGFRGIRGVTSEVARPAESVAARGAWLLAQDAVTGLFVDNGRCEFSSTKKMTKTNYRNRYPGDVLADMALAQGGANYHVQDYGAGPELIFRDDNASTADSSSLRISNVLADTNSTTLYPSKDAVLTRDPGRVKSQLALEWAQGNVYESRAATASDFNGVRFGIATNSDIKTKAKAAEEARDILWQLHTEEDFIECSVEVTAAQVNLIMAGYRIQAKFSHLATEGFGSFTWFRVLSRTVKPLVSEDPQLYELQLKLSPQEAAPVSSCGYPLTEAGTFYPLGDQPPTGPSEWYAANVSDGFTYYLRPGIFYPTVPTPGAESQWHFIAHVGAGGAGSIDYAGDCVQNTLQFMPVGPGTLTVQTEIYGGSPRPMAGSWGESPDAYANSIGSFTSGDEVEFVVTGECVNIVRLYDGPGSPCGGKWGWSSAEWVPA
jgi:hypothetical protein